MPLWASRDAWVPSVVDGAEGTRRLTVDLGGSSIEILSYKVEVLVRCVLV